MSDNEMQEQIKDVVRGLIRDKGNRVYEWPEDEAAAYRSNGGFEEGRAAVEEIRVAKGLAALLPIVNAAKRDAWDEAIRFSIECGNETTDSWGNMYRLDWIARMEHEIEENPYAQEAPHAR